MEILIDNRTQYSFDTEIITNIVKAVLLHENFAKDAEVSISIVGGAEIRTINNRFRNIDKETDVLSFPLSDSENDDDDGLLGDIIINIERVFSQSEEYGHSFERELCFLTVHGMLHLLGYDHMNDDEERTMFGKQEEILSKVGIERESRGENK